MPRKRNIENKGLPQRWRYTRNAYYYQVPPGLENHWDGKKTFRLGKTLREAYKTWAERLDKKEDIRSVGELLDRYAREVTPTKAIATQRNEVKYIKRLKSVFGPMSLSEIVPRMIYSYVDRSASKTVARKDVKLLSHAYTKAVEWGYLDSHPFKGEVRFKNAPPRTRYVEDWEITECLSLKSKHHKGSINVIRAYIKLKLLTGMDRSTLLRLQVSDLKDDGIHTQRHKTVHTTGKRTIYSWTAELRAVVNEAIQLRPAISNYIFSTRRGVSYINEDTGSVSGWESMWQRFMDRVLTETKMVERFTEHDLRAKCASDAETLEHARALLAHADSKITNRVYRRKPEIVKPLK